jgi:ribosome maturation factor RimP
LKYTGNLLNKKEIEVEELLAPTITSLGCEIWGVEFLSQGKHTKLRVYIEREGGVDVDNCAEVSRHASDILDVSSPGLDRILFKEQQFQAYAGHQIDVRLNFPFEGKKKFVGTLAGVEDHSAVVQMDDEEILLPIENIQKARVVPVFD